MLAWHSTLAGRGQRRFDNLVAAVTVGSAIASYTQAGEAAVPLVQVSKCAYLSAVGQSKSQTPYARLPAKSTRSPSYRNPGALPCDAAPLKHKPHAQS